MSKRPPRKSRVAAEKVRVVVQPPANRQDGYAEPPGYSGHNGGSFSEAGYRSGRGQFGFVHETLP